MQKAQGEVILIEYNEYSGFDTKPELPLLRLREIGVGKKYGAAVTARRC
jgi:hypothetical protein